MTSAPTPSGPSARQLFEMRVGVAPVVFEASGLWHPAGMWRRGGEFTAYDDVTAIAASPGGLWLGTRRGVWLLRGSLFGPGGGPEALAREITARIAARPRGAEQLSRMVEVEALAARRRGARVCTLLALVCLAVFACQDLGVPFVHEAGAFRTQLALAGEWWRLLTANVLHANLGHLLANLVGLFFLGSLVERPLGSARTAVIMAVSALASMGASLLAGAEDVVGASGVVFGLAGAALFLEFFRADRLPATLRLPRRLFLFALAADIALGAALPFIAGTAHVGGLVGGFLAAALCARDRTLRAAPGGVVQGVAAASALVLVAALASGAQLVSGQPDALIRHGRRLLALPGLQALDLNNVAWRLGTDGRATARQLEQALAMAERAADETGHREPDVLDTLAELQFATGHTQLAIDTIDEAIALAPNESYFVEQRRRFTGERAPDDRPEPPAENAPYRVVPPQGAPPGGVPPEREAPPGPRDDGGVWI